MKLITLSAIRYGLAAGALYGSYNLAMSGHWVFAMLFGVAALAFA